MANHITATAFAARVALVQTVNGDFDVYVDGKETGLRVMLENLRHIGSDRTGSLELTIEAGRVDLRGYAEL